MSIPFFFPVFTLYICRAPKINNRLLGRLPLLNISASESQRANYRTVTLFLVAVLFFYLFNLKVNLLCHKK